MRPEIHYRKVSCSIHADQKYRNLSDPQPCGKFLWHIMLFGRYCGVVPGTILATPDELAAHLKWDAKGFAKPFAELLAEGLAEATSESEKAGFIWLPNGMRHNPPANPNVVKHWSTAWYEVPECDLKNKALHDIKGFLKGFGKAFEDPFAKHLERVCEINSINNNNNKNTNKIINKNTNNILVKKEKETLGNNNVPDSADPHAGKQRPRLRVKIFSPESLETAEYLRDAILEHAPAFAWTDSDIQGWAVDIDLAVRKNGRTHQQLRNAIDYAHRRDDETFWRPNIKSGGKLRKQFDTLAMQARRDGIANRNNVTAAQLDEMARVMREEEERHEKISSSGIDIQA